MLPGYYKYRCHVIILQVTKISTQLQNIPITTVYFKVLELLPQKTITNITKGKWTMQFGGKNMLKIIFNSFCSLFWSNKITISSNAHSCRMLAYFHHCNEEKYI
jgi:hypothetical protein